MKDDPRSSERNLCNYVTSLKKKIENSLNYLGFFSRTSIMIYHGFGII